MSRTELLIRIEPWVVLVAICGQSSRGYHPCHPHIGRTQPLSKFRTGSSVAVTESRAHVTHSRIVILPVDECSPITTSGQCSFDSTIMFNAPVAPATTTPEKQEYYDRCDCQANDNKHACHGTFVIEESRPSSDEIFRPTGEISLTHLRCRYCRHWPVS